MILPAGRSGNPADGARAGDSGPKPAGHYSHHLLNRNDYEIPL